MAQELEAGVHGEAELIEIATRLACEGYWEDIKQVMEVSRVFRYDEQLWDAMKDVPGVGTRKRTRLIYAAHVNDLERVRFLLARGARVTKTNIFGATPLHCASTLEVVRELCKKGATINACGEDGITVLMEASRNGLLEVVRELCERGAHVNAACTDDGYTALMWASQNSHLDVVRELCERGADVDASRTDGFTALMGASETGHLKVVSELCKRGVNVNAVTTNESMTALILASQKGHLEIVHELCESGANVDAARTDDGSNALMWASQNGHVDMCKNLLAHGATKSTLDSQGCSAYDLVQNGKSYSTLRELLTLSRRSSRLKRV